MVRIAGPDLGTVDDVLIAEAIRPAFERGQIGTSIRLRIALAPGNIRIHDTRQKLLFLHVSTKFDDGRT